MHQGFRLYWHGTPCLRCSFSVIPALMLVVGSRALNLDLSRLGLLFASLGAGSVAAASFIIPWLRARYSSNTLIILANLLVVLVYVSMAVVQVRR